MALTLRRAGLAAAVCTLALVATTACSSGSASDQGGAASGPVTLQYAMWDDTQVPAYQACADAFHAANPDITVKITQTAYADYWNKLTTGFVADTAPDVFVNVTSYYPEFAANDQIVNLTPLIEKDKVDMSAYQPGTGDNWVMDGKVYGLQKDLDAIGLVYNADAVKKAGLTDADLKDLTWNPDDGGTYAKVIKELTIDSSGRNGLDPAFDKSSVSIYGSAAPSLNDSIVGQTTWGNLAASAGAKIIDKNPFGTKYSFDDPAIVKTLAWYRTMIADGYMLDPAKAGDLGMKAMLSSKKIATGTNGSWVAGDFATAGVPLKWAKFPAGPSGVKVYSNSIADSITTGSKHQDQAWSWVKFLGTPQCQDLVAAKGVVFPALKVSTDKAAAAYKAKGIDLTAIQEELAGTDTRIQLPVSDHYNEISKLAGPVLQGILLGKSDPATALSQLTTQVNALFS